MISQPWHLLCWFGPDSKGAFMADKDMGRKSQGSPPDSMDRDDQEHIRGRADEMEDASESDEFDDMADLNEEDEDNEDNL